MRKPRAFTLVEVLVVISILAMLMAIMISAVQAATRVAKRTRCQGQLRQIMDAVRVYVANDSSNRLPCVNDPDHGKDIRDPPFGGWNANRDAATNPEARDPTSGRYLKPLNPFLKSKGYEVLRCPADQGESPDADITKSEELGYSYKYVSDNSLEGQGIVQVIFGTWPPPPAPVPDPNPDPDAPPPPEPLPPPPNLSYWEPDDEGNALPRPAFNYGAGYWSRAARKVVLVDWDALFDTDNSDLLSGTNRGFWHYVDPTPRTNAAFLDGHVGTIQLNQYTAGGSCAIHPNGDCPGISRDHDYY